MKLLKPLSEILCGKTINRVYQNQYISKLDMSGIMIDLGSKSDSPSYYEHMNLSKVTHIDFADLYSEKDNIRKIDLTEEFPIEDETYDTILLFNVIEHLPKYEITIKECQRILKKGGTLHILVPFFFPHHDDPKDFRRFTLDGLENVAKHTDLQLQASYYPKVSPLLTFFDFLAIWLFPGPLRSILRPITLLGIYLLSIPVSLCRPRFNNIDAMQAFAPFYAVNFKKPE